VISLSFSLSQNWSKSEVFAQRKAKSESMVMIYSTY